MTDAVDGQGDRDTGVDPQGGGPVDGQVDRLVNGQVDRLVNGQVDRLVDRETFVGFCDEALVAMRDIVLELGDELANRRPDLPGANSPFAILTHCLGVTARWASTVNLGEVVPRDRDAEFSATGAVATLAADTDRIRGSLRDWVARTDLAAPPLRPTSPREDWYAATAGGVLMHVYEELSQHRGQLELTRDVLRAGG